MRPIPRYRSHSASLCQNRHAALVNAIACIELDVADAVASTGEHQRLPNRRYPCLQACSETQGELTSSALPRAALNSSVLRFAANALICRRSSSKSLPGLVNFNVRISLWTRGFSRNHSLMRDRDVTRSTSQSTGTQTRCRHRIVENPFKIRSGKVGAGGDRSSQKQPSGDQDEDRLQTGRSSADSLNLSLRPDPSSMRTIRPSKVTVLLPAVLKIRAKPVRNSSPGVNVIICRHPAPFRVASSAALDVNRLMDSRPAQPCRLRTRAVAEDPGLGFAG